jgi:uncharacterized membrane protein YeiH
MAYPGVEELEHLRPYVELTAVAAGAISGSLHARRRGFDFVGVEAIGVASGLGGGLIRDMMLGRGPALALQSPALLVTALVAAPIGALFGSLATRLRRTMWAIDTLALGLFAVAGLQRAEAAGLSLAPALFLGIVTTVGGGLVRDVLCRETPIVLLPGQPYAVTALLAGVVYMTALRGLGAAPLTAEVLAVASAVALRTLAAWRGWVVPTPLEVSLRMRRRLRRDSDRSNDPGRGGLPGPAPSS